MHQALLCISSGLCSAVSSGCKFSLQPEAFLCCYHLMYFLSPPGCKTVTFELFYPGLASLLLVVTRCPPHQLCPCPVSAGRAPSGVTPRLFPPQSTLPCSGGTCAPPGCCVSTCLSTSSGRVGCMQFFAGKVFLVCKNHWICNIRN